MSCSSILYFDPERNELVHSVGCLWVLDVSLSEIQTLDACSNFRSRDCSEASGLSESIGAVRALPGESGAAATEMAIGGGGLVNRTAQVESFNDGLGRHREKFTDQRGDFFLGHHSNAECLRHDGDRFGDADGVSQLHFRLARQARSHDVLC